jgi:hypothetical protein
VFGLPGRGKTHAAAALGHALVQRGFSVLFTPTFRLVQDLLAAKWDLSLPRALQKLDAFDLRILDDIGYVQQNAEEVEVLFTLMAERSIPGNRTDEFFATTTVGDGRHAGRPIGRPGPILETFLVVSRWASKSDASHQSAMLRGGLPC